MVQLLPSRACFQAASAGFYEAQVLGHMHQAGRARVEYRLFPGRTVKEGKGFG